VTRTIFIQACRDNLAGSASSHPIGVGSAGLILDLAYRRPTFYRQFARHKAAVPSVVLLTGQTRHDRELTREDGFSDG
jgi:hypothetical protein